jgi:hypothetical protein
MAGIFISYRRDDSRHAAGRLGDDLTAVFGAPSIFRDVESIAPGVDFEVALDQALANCAVMLVVIGPRWATITDREGRRRLDQPGDWIRIEVARALERNVRLIPVMLEDTPLPDVAALPSELRPLVRRQTLPLSDGRWKGDIARLVETLERIPGVQRLAPKPAPSPVPAPAPEPAKGHGGLWKGVALGAGGLLVLAVLLAEPSTDPQPAGPGGETPAPGPAPAPQPAPAPSPAPSPSPAPVQQAPQALMPPDQLQAIANRVLQGRWQAEHDPTVFIEMQQVGDRVSAQFQANGVAIGQGQGSFDGRQLQMQIQVELLGQPLMQGRCAMQWVPGQGRLMGPCQWPTGVEASVWGKRG